MNSVITVGTTALRFIRHVFRVSMRVEIQNRCSGFELTSPVYFCDGAVYNMPLDQSIASSGSTQTKFRINPTRSMFQGGIMYNLRATSTPPNKADADNTMTETNGTTSTSMQFLLVWKVSRVGDPYLFTILLEHDRSFTWNEKKIKTTT
jgi:hypothetical protein